AAPAARPRRSSSGRDRRSLRHRYSSRADRRRRSRETTRRPRSCSENEHPGYASEPDGSDHLVDLLKTITSGPQAKDTLVVVTYDEFGGQWDHVSPPAVDKWGPGTRIPALVLSAGMVKSGVDHTQYDTTSIMATIERSYDLAPVADRDAKVNDLTAAVRLGDPRGHGQDGR
ncbi:MAG TPA: alkaline phosphatase family protein, partial [Lapillicoccus sp.]|nr:alkaline phosphatase family protein [Lapillicoccus sp.]